jgi:hypothetical protein
MTHRVGDLDIFERGQIREQAMVLKDKTDLLESQTRASLLVEAIDLGALQENPAGCRRFETCEGVEKRALATARRAEDGARFFGRDGERKIAKDIDPCGVIAIRL